MQYIDDQTSLIQSLFSASTSGTWQEFLTPLRDLTQADGVMLLFQPARGTARIWANGAGCEALQPLLPSLRFDRVYGQEDLTGAQPFDGFFRLAKVRAGTNDTATLCIGREPHRRDFRSPDRQFLTTVIPFLGQSLTTWSQLNKQRTEAAQSDSMIAHLGAAWIRTDFSGNILSMSPNAPDLRIFTNMRLADRLRLEFADPEVALRFRTAFAACAGQGTPAVVYSAVSDTELSLQRTEDNEVLIQIREAPEHATLRPEGFAEHFGLNRNEARLAALICDGHSLKAAAAALGWTNETTRSYSKSIFARMGVQGQTSLLRRVLSSGVTFGD